MEIRRPPECAVMMGGSDVEVTKGDAGLNPMAHSYQMFFLRVPKEGVMLVGFGPFPAAISHVLISLFQEGIFNCG